MNNSILGMGWSFPPDFSEVNQGVSITSDEQNILNSLDAIVSTLPGERVMRIDFGCNLRDHVFESLNLTEISIIKNTIKIALEEHEPRITVENIIIDTQDQLNGTITIEVEYTIIQTNQRTNFVFPYYMTEGTEL